MLISNSSKAQDLAWTFVGVDHDDGVDCSWVTQDSSNCQIWFQGLTGTCGISSANVQTKEKVEEGRDKCSTRMKKGKRR